MKGFEDVIGHEQIKEHLQNALRNRRIYHAYILNGEDGAGKNLLAAAFAKALVCEAGYGDACNMCDACKLFDAGTHPDVRYVTHETPASIGVSDIRSQIVGDIMLKPYRGRRKVYIIDEAEKMTPQAQNALLKTIEEPPEYAVILLLTNNVELFLPTVRSRCICLDLRPVSQEQITKLLMEKYQVPDYNARICAAYSQGNTGKAINMATSEKFHEMHDYLVNILRNIQDMEVYEVVDDFHMKISGRQEMLDVLDLMTVWFHDVLILKATADVNQIVYQDEYRFLLKQTYKPSYGDISEILDAIQKAGVRIRANVNRDTTIELLISTIKEKLDD